VKIIHVEFCSEVSWKLKKGRKKDNEGGERNTGLILEILLTRM
jgi:hypothetical protein